ncbi:MAG: ATP-binding protein [Candidatus Symbiothrix sp.]|jgi:AAA15 family ATPase/GTPase|nr:ATP-binding protein [Candidatus Symbiothrix sp.]
MISKVSISNYKSIQNLEIPLANVNVFIGENGSGKSNILEAIGMACAAQNNQLTTEDLFYRGIRVAKPALTFSSFLEKKQSKEIEISLIGKEEYKSKLFVENEEDIFSVWKNKNNNIPKDQDFYFNFLIFNLNSNVLRGFIIESQKKPLGIYGEGLDILLSTFSKEQIEEIKSYNFINWLEDFVISDNLQFAGYKLGRSLSKLYFTDKYMQKKNNLFSAENANEGALFILFYLALFISEKTPAFFAIDNIETALNPHLGRELMYAITQLAVKYNKQVLITTHNPAILDGLNLFDENQKLFIVKRKDNGQTVAEELKAKPQIKEGKYKLSELWMRGFIGGLPKDF